MTDESSGRSADDTVETRQQRLQNALRANLKRRKQADVPSNGEKAALQPANSKEDAR